MTDLEKAIVSIKCVLSSSPSIPCSVGGASFALEAALEEYLECLVQGATNDLCYAIRKLGHEVHLEYRVDGLEGRDYALSVSTSRGSDDKIAALTEAFHKKVRHGFEDLPSMKESLEEGTAGKA